MYIIQKRPGTYRAFLCIYAPDGETPGRSALQVFQLSCNIVPCLHFQPALKIAGLEDPAHRKKMLQHLFPAEDIDIIRVAVVFQPYRPVILLIDLPALSQYRQVRIRKIICIAVC